MHRWEDELCFRANDRVVRPFELGAEWCANWLPDVEPVSTVEELIALNEILIARSREFFGYQKPQDYRLAGNWLEFTSPVATPYNENNIVRALWYPARNPNGKAVVLLPHWNSKLPQHNALCAGLQRLGISSLRLSLPYHDARMPAGLTRADYAVSANVGRTIHAARQAVIDVRCCFDWLESVGYNRFGIVFANSGENHRSLVANLAAAS